MQNEECRMRNVNLRPRNPLSWRVCMGALWFAWAKIPESIRHAYGVPPLFMQGSTKRAKLRAASLFRQKRVKKGKAPAHPSL